MAATPLFCTGFGHQLASASGGGLFDSVTAATTVDTTNPRRAGGSSALVTVPLNAFATFQKNIGGATKVVERFAVRAGSLPSSEREIHRLNGSTNPCVLTVDNTGTLRLQVSAGTQQVGGAALTTTGYLLVEVQVDLTAGTADWKLDGAAQTQATGAGMGTGSAFSFGHNTATGPAYSVRVTDWIFGTWATAGTDWWGDGEAAFILPGSDGTHSFTANDFSTGEAGTLRAPSYTLFWQMVDDPAPWSTTRSTTDNIALRVANAAAYVEIAPAASASGKPNANAVRALMAYSATTATANLAACEVRNSAGAVAEIWGLINGVGKDTSEVTNFFKGALATKPAGNWTNTEIDAVRWRVGGCTSVDVSPVPTWQMLALEVDYPTSAAATSFAIPNRTARNVLLRR